MPLFTEEKIKELKANCEEPEVLEAELRKLNSLDVSQDSLRKNLESIKKANDEYHRTPDNTDALDTHKKKKIESDLLLKQQTQDLIISSITDLNTRLDDIEITLSRRERSYDDALLSSDEKLSGETLAFRDSVASVVCDSMFEQTKKPIDVGKYKPEISVKQYLRYKSLLFDYMIGGDNRELINYFKDELTVQYPPAAGWLVTPVIAAEIKQKEAEMDPILNYVSKVSLSYGDRFEQYVSFTNPEARMRESEHDAGAEDQVREFDKFMVPINEMYRKVKITMQAMSDVPNAEKMIGEEAGRAIALTEGRKIIEGDGLIEPRGVLTYPDGLDYGEIERINVGAEIEYDGIIDLIYALPEYALARADARIFVNRLAMKDILKIKDEQSRPLWQPALMAGQPSTLHGRAIEMSPRVPYAADEPVMLIGVWGEAYLWAERSGITVFRDPYTQFPLIIIDISKRIGGGVRMPDYVKIGMKTAIT